MYYAFDGGARFCETLEFGARLPGPASPLRAGFVAALDALHLAAGISYYKAFLPPRMTIAGWTPDRYAGNFFHTLYREGLGEFSARNRVKVWDRIDFPCADEETPPAEASPLPRRSAVLLGGGKDSLVCLEILRAGGEPLTLFAVNPRQPMRECAAAAGLPLAAVTRKLDDKLFALNKAGALNGHVPATAIVSLIALAAAFVHGWDTVVLSCERSAEEGNLVYDGHTVNHQYSKTLAFERLLGDYVTARICPSLSYFSLLRPLSEFHIAKLMAREGRYDAAFTSCNRAFVIRPEKSPERWCCDCPKCRFSFLILAGAMGRSRMARIFGRNLLDDPAQLSGYRELVGLDGHKPWECVGEIAESATALLALAEDEAWRNCAIVSSLAPALRAKLPDWRRLETALMTSAEAHRLPSRYESMLHAYLG